MNYELLPSFQSPCLLVTPSPRHLVTPHPFTPSPRHPFTPSPRHLVTLSPCHLVTLSPCHLVTLSPCHLVTGSRALSGRERDHPIDRDHRALDRRRGRALERRAVLAVDVGLHP